MMLDALRECVVGGPVTGTSGVVHDWYVDVRSLLLVGRYLDDVCRHFHDHLGLRDRPLVVAGTGVGGTLLVGGVLALDGCLARLGGLEPRPRLLGCVLRPAPKAHGLGRQIEGEAAGQEAILLDDVLSTGGTLREMTFLLRAAGVTVNRAMVVLDRGEGGKALLEAEGVSVHSYYHADDLSPVRRSGG